MNNESELKIRKIKSRSVADSFDAQKISIRQAQDKQDEIFKKMSADRKLKLASKISFLVSRIIMSKIRSRYPKANHLFIFKKFWENIEARRKQYNNLFNQYLRKELDKYQKLM